MATDSVELRSSVYYLTYALARLQKKTLSVDGIAPTASRRPDGLLRAANRLATLFTKVLPDEKNTAVALVTGMVPDQVDAWIIRELMLVPCNITSRGTDIPSRSEADSPNSSMKSFSKTQSPPNRPDLIISKNSEMAK
jgi:hypothetical protein